MVRDTPPFQDVSTYQIWNSYLKAYRRYGPDTKAGRTDGQTDGRTDSAITICLPKFLWGHKNITPETSLNIYISKEESKDRESIQSNTTSDPKFPKLSFCQKLILHQTPSYLYLICLHCVFTVLD